MREVYRKAIRWTFGELYGVPVGSVDVVWGGRRITVRCAGKTFAREIDSGDDRFISDEEDPVHRHANRITLLLSSVIPQDEQLAFSRTRPGHLRCFAHVAFLRAAGPQGPSPSVDRRSVLKNLNCTHRRPNRVDRLRAYYFRFHCRMRKYHRRGFGRYRSCLQNPRWAHTRKLIVGHPVMLGAVSRHTAVLRYRPSSAAQMVSLISREHEGHL
jgi:hypothetical protein